MENCVRSVLPAFGRMVVFSTTDTSWHGQPHPLACAPDRSRLSIALYYYTAERPKHEQSESHSTLYREMPGSGNLLSPVQRLRDWIRRS